MLFVITRKEFFENTAYINYNGNPKGLKTGDCVIRALSKATGKSWDEVYTELCEIGYKKKRLKSIVLLMKKSYLFIILKKK